MSDRGAMRSHIVIRLADEGVPVAAIARVVKRTYNEVASIIDGALSQALIVTRPPADWPPGKIRYTPPAVTEIREQRTFGGLKHSERQIPFALHLSAKEETLLAALMLRPQLATKNFLHHALYGLDPSGGAEPKIVDVFLCKIRRKLEPHGIAIETMWGKGYALPAASLARIAEMKAQELAAFAAAVGQAEGAVT